MDTPQGRLAGRYIDRKIGYGLASTGAAVPVPLLLHYIPSPWLVYLEAVEGGVGGGSGNGSMSRNFSFVSLRGRNLEVENTYSNIYILMLEKW